MNFIEYTYLYGEWKVDLSKTYRLGPPRSLQGPGAVGWGTLGLGRPRTGAPVADRSQAAALLFRGTGIVQRTALVE